MDATAYRTSSIKRPRRSKADIGVIGRHIERTIREFAPEANVHFMTVAVTPAQIRKWNLPSRPTKKSDTRKKALSATRWKLRQFQLINCALAERCIVKHVDQGTLGRLRVVEDAERDTLQTMIDNMVEGNADS